jgi:hypothetical protein
MRRENSSDTLRRVKREIAVALLFAALAVVMTWPLAPNAGRAVAYPQDPYLNTWILDWVQHAVTSDATLFDTNVLHPRRDTLALSENMLGIALPLLPLRWLGASPLVVHNVAMLLGFALSGYGMYVAARLLTGCVGGAVVAGIFFAFVPWRFTHFTHVQHMWTLWLPLMLAALWWCFQDDTPRLKKASLFGVAFFMNGVTNLHWLAFGSLAIGLTYLLLAISRKRIRLDVLVATLLATAALMPILLPYARVKQTYNLRTSADEPLLYSAAWSDWGIASLHNHLWGARTNDGSVHPERWLFPGVLVLVLAVIGIVYAYRSRHRDALWIALLWTALGFLGSLGLHFPLHTFLREFVPLFGGIRAPARWAMIAYCGLALLAAFGVSALMRFRGRAAAAAVIALAMLFELNAAPVRWYLLDPRPAPVYRWLATQPANAVVELPMTHRYTYEYIFRSTVHHHPLVNGVPEPALTSYWDLVALQNTPAFLAALQKTNVSHVIVHGDILDTEWETTRAWLRDALARGQLHYAARFDAKQHGDFVFTMRPSPPPDAAQQVALQQFLDGKPVQNGSVFGYLDQPHWDARAGETLLVSGWAMSPYGIREVRVHLGNRRWMERAELAPYPEVQQLHPWYPMTTAPAFSAKIRRPKGMPEWSDVQVEIIDNRGDRKLLDDVWFIWPKGEAIGPIGQMGPMGPIGLTDVSPAPLGEL